MLLQFRFQNHRSFREETALSLADPRDAAGGPEYLSVAALYGANAAGKSNVFDALHTVSTVVSAGTSKKTENLPVHPFKLDADTFGSPSEFELVFRVANSTYTYSISLSRTAVHHESLHLGMGQDAQLMFSRKGQDFQFGSVFEGADRRQLAQLVGEGTRPNQPFVREAEKRNLTEVGAVTEWIDSQLAMIPANAPFHRLGNLLDQQPEFRKLAGRLLQGADTGIAEIHVEKIDTELPSERRELMEQAFRNLVQASGLDQDQVATEVQFPTQHARVRLSHRGTAGSLYTLDLEDESDGTQRLLNLAPALWSDDEHSPLVFVVDEIDQSLHPHVVEHFVREFRRQRPDCQLIFTTHAEHLLDCGALTPAEVWFVEKSREGASTLYSLHEYDPEQLSELRANQGGFGRGYLHGRFGAVPRVRSSLDENDG